MALPINYLADIVHWYKNPNWYQVAAGLISTAVLGTLAIFGSNIRAIFIRPKFKIGIKKTDQTIAGETKTMFRLHVLNGGHRTAKDVTIMVTKIEDKIKNRWVKRSNFIHMPLVWTHLDTHPRSIYPKQEVYINLAEYYIFDDEGGLHLSTIGVEDKNLRLIENDARLTVHFSERDGFRDEIVVNVKWSLEEFGPILTIV
jgi:hypothetical protein